MKVVHLITNKTGGAANAAIRLNNALNEQGVESSVLAVEDIIATIPLYKRLLVKSKRKVYDKIISGNAISFYTNDLYGYDFLAVKEVNDADIIHLHWVSDGFIGFKELKKILSLGKPIVWTLHDMHPFTGGCHYDMECGRYKEKCGSCPVLQSNKEKDFSTYNQRKKEKILSAANLLVIGCSDWIRICASKSAVMKGQRCISIPNCINTNTFKPLDKKIARNLLNICTEKKILLFGAMNATSDKRKGFFYLQKALCHLDPSKYALAVFGGQTENFSGYETYNLGSFFDEISLCTIYNAADAFIAPSVQENLANTVMESLACGIPVIAFDIGGMSDMIRHKENGYLARPFDDRDLAKGVQYACDEAERLGRHARNMVEQTYSYSIVGKRYLKEYQRLLN